MIRHFNEKDMHFILEAKQAIVASNFPGEKLDMRFYKPYVRKHAKGILIAEADGKPVGCIIYKIGRNPTGKTGSIESLFVKKAFRGRGIGSALIEAAEQQLKKKGVRKTKAVIAVSNKASLNLHKKHGYNKKRIIVEKVIS